MQESQTQSHKAQKKKKKKHKHETPQVHKAQALFFLFSDHKVLKEKIRVNTCELWRLEAGLAR